MIERSRVKVVVRVRPQLVEDNVWVQPVSNTVLQTLNHRNVQEALQYEFASVFGADSTQKCVYDGCVRPILNNILKGKNASVFAYGPTGAGKTHTILGSVDDPGVIPRCVKELFRLLQEDGERLNAEGETWESSVKFSYLEIYNEKVFDLVHPGQHTDLPIREDGHKHIFVAGLAETEIKSVQEFNESFGPASKNRTTAATKLNERSSRSHSILLLKVCRVQKSPPYRRLTGKLYIIDLAGSEDNRRTGNQGMRLKESGAINSSLLALGQVVDALNKGQPCVPYRASKLTRLLQDSLGGSAMTCMIVNLAPEERHYYDTLCTLRFACKTKKIVNNVTINESFERPVAVKRALPDSTQDVEPKKPKIERKPEPKPAPEPEPAPQTPVKPPPQAPFLSPLLRQQANLRTEMLHRLEALEGRLLQQIGTQSQPTPPSDNEPDSTSDCDDTAAKENKCPNPPAPLQELRQLQEKLKAMKGMTPEPPKPEPCRPKARQTRRQGKRKGPVFADGSVMDNCKDVSSSPLFRRDPKKSTAAPRETTATFNTNAQQEHNARILELLNTGSLKDLQTLQRVGAKRASLIHSWRQLNGSFTSFNDLKDIIGLTPKYIDTLLKANLVHLET